MIRFVEKPHSIRAETMIEIWDDDRFLAGIYPGGRDVPDAPVVRIISPHLGGARSDGPDHDGLSAIEVFFTIAARR